MLVRRKIIQIDEKLCDGCGLCVLDCAENAIAVIDGKAKVIADRFCDGLGACLSSCPRNALHIVEREAEPFDEQAIQQAHQPAASSGMPDPQPPQFLHPLSCPSSSPTDMQPGVHWPLKLRLSPPSLVLPSATGFLLTADCVPAVSPAFHEFLKKRRLFLACPKFEDGEALTDRLCSILARNPQTGIAILRMEVPCCRGLRSICEQALHQAGRTETPCEYIMTRNGQIREETVGQI